MNPNQCPACQYQNIPCERDCIYAPLFPSDNPSKFEIVMTVFGFETLKFFIKDLPPQQRKTTAETIFFEAYSFYIDPDNGRTDLVTALQNFGNQTSEELSEAKKLLEDSSKKIVLALPAMSRRPEMVSSDESDEEFQNGDR